jgi:hypothetical protein
MADSTGWLTRWQSNAGGGNDKSANDCNRSRANIRDCYVRLSVRIKDSSKAAFLASITRSGLCRLVRRTGDGTAGIKSWRSRMACPSLRLRALFVQLGLRLWMSPPRGSGNGLLRTLRHSGCEEHVIPSMINGPSLPRPSNTLLMSLV